MDCFYKTIYLFPFWISANWLTRSIVILSDFFVVVLNRAAWSQLWSIAPAHLQHQFWTLLFMLTKKNLQFPRSYLLRDFFLPCCNAFAFLLVGTNSCFFSTVQSSLFRTRFASTLWMTIESVAVPDTISSIFIAKFFSLMFQQRRQSLDKVVLTKRIRLRFQGDVTCQSHSCI